MILQDIELQLLGPDLLDPFDPELVNPASIDIRLGKKILEETPDGFREVDLTQYSKEVPFFVLPHTYLMVSTYEKICVPNGYAMELKLKSSKARAGLDHALAFWFDPGWDGVGTMEFKNWTQWKMIPFWYGMRVAQIVVHRCVGPCAKPYQGRYQGAGDVESEKPEQ